MNAVRATDLRLRAEFAALYLAAPVAFALAMPSDVLFPVVLALTALGAVLLHRTPGFEWRELTRGWRRVAWGRLAVLCALTAVISLALVLWLRPHALFEPGRSRPLLLAAILILYPVLSALPQELLFRPLFFRRYGALLPPGTWPPIVANAAVFSLAHLVYWSWVVTLTTFAGGIALAHAYRARGSFAEAVLLHALAGCILFALGLGAWFYAGNATRPF